MEVGGGGTKVENVEIVESRRVGTSLTNICRSVLTSISYGIPLYKGGWDICWAYKGMAYGS